MEINATDLDLLKELGNIGAGNAASALSEMIGMIVDINVPRCEMVPFAEIEEIIGDPEHVILGVLVRMEGDLEGYLLMAQELEDAAATIKLLLGQEVTLGEEIRIEEYEPMKEVCNILAGSYVSAIAEMTGLKIKLSVPEMTADMAMAIMNVPILVYGEIGDSVLMLDTQFGGAAESVRGHFFMVPTMESLQDLKQALGM